MGAPARIACQSRRKRWRVMRSRGTRSCGPTRIGRACAAGWEGLIAKRADGRYRGGRSRDWLKLKCVLEQEVVIGGFTEPRRSRVGLGALLVGYHEDGVLRYGGKAPFAVGAVLTGVAWLWLLQMGFVLGS